MFNLKGKSVVVVGGSGDLGNAIVEAYLESQSSVVVIDIEPSIQERSRSSHFHFIKADISNRVSVESSFKEALNFLGNIDILVNCAGIQRRNKPEDFTIQDWDNVIEINLTATFLFCQLAGREMLKKNYGKIINVSSIMSSLGGTTIPAYSASKGGVTQLTKALSNDWSSKGICVNAIAPGYFKTKLNTTSIFKDPTRYNAILSRIPVGRFGEPEDLKGLIIFLSSKESDYITGSTITIDGGYTSW